MWRLFYHVVWRTEGGQSLIEGEIRRLVYGAIMRKAEELGAIVHAIGGTGDHVHVVLTIPPQLALADCVRALKLASAQEVNRRMRLLTPLFWQKSYGAFTFGERSLPVVIEYVQRQEQLHSSGEIKPYYEQAEDGR